MNINRTPAPRLAREVPKASDFAPLARKADTSKNRRRGARKATRATRTIL